MTPIEERNALATEGFVVLEGALSPEFMSAYRAKLHDYFHEKSGATRRKDGLVSDFDPDALGRLPAMRDILHQTRLFDRVAEVLGYRPAYCHHSDVHINKTAPFHRDSIKKASYFDFAKEEIFGSTDYAVYKIGIYFQEHAGAGGLSVIPGSHLVDRPAEPERAYDIKSKVGDVILFDTRIYHKGIERFDERDCEGDRMSFFMTLAKDNRITREFVNGTIWRQNRQIRRNRYDLPSDLADELASLGFSVIPYEVCPQPSPAAVIEQLDVAHKSIRELQKENARLLKAMKFGPARRVAEPISRVPKLGKKVLRALGLR
jgi:hypothetical protein